MITYACKTFCTHYTTCTHGKTCHKALTDAVEHRAMKDKLPVRIYPERPQCYQEAGK